MESKKSLKSLWCILTTLLAAFVALMALTFEASAKTYGDYEYTVLNDGTAEINRYSGSATELIIPLELDGYKVTSLNGWVFGGNANLTSITIPESVKMIGRGTFNNREPGYSETSLNEIVFWEMILKCQWMRS